MAPSAGNVTISQNDISANLTVSENTPTHNSFDNYFNDL